MSRDVLTKSEYSTGKIEEMNVVLLGIAEERSFLEKEISEIKNSLQSATITTSWHKVCSQMNQNLIELEHENSTTILDLKN